MDINIKVINFQSCGGGKNMLYRVDLGAVFQTEGGSAADVDDVIDKRRYFGSSVQIVLSVPV